MASGTEDPGDAAVINTKRAANPIGDTPRSRPAGVVAAVTVAFRAILVIVALVCAVLVITGGMDKSDVLKYIGPVAVVTAALGFWQYRLLRYRQFQILLVGSLIGVVAETFREQAVLSLVGHVAAQVLIAAALIGFIVAGNRRNPDRFTGLHSWLELSIVAGAIAAWFVSAVPRAWHLVPDAAGNLYEFVLGPFSAAIVFIPAVLLLSRVKLKRGSASRGPAFLAVSYVLQFVGLIASAAQVTSAQELVSTPPFVLLVLFGLIAAPLALLEPSIVGLATGDVPLRAPRSWQRTAWLLLVPAAVIGAVAIGADSWNGIVWPVLLLMSIGLMAVRSRITADEFIAKRNRRRDDRDTEPPPLPLEDLLAWSRAVDLPAGDDGLEFGVIAVIPKVDLDEGQRGGAGIDDQIDQETLRRLRDVMRSGERLDPTWRGEWAVCHDRDRFIVVRVRAKGEPATAADSGSDASAPEEIFGVPRLAASFGRWLTLPFRTLPMTVRIDFALGYSTGVLPIGGDLRNLIQEAVWAAQSSVDETPTAFDPEKRNAHRRRAQLGALLDDALLDGTDLSVVYEPIVDLRSGETVGAETLARWNPAGWGMVSPGEFIPIAEQTKAILDLGEWVLSTACRAAMLLPDRRGVSVNMSGIELGRPDLVRRVMQVLDQTGMDPADLTIEITETVVPDVVEKATEGLKALVDAGVKLSMDDFGTEASGLSRLLILPWSSIKLDRSLVFGLQSEEALGASLIRAVVQLAGEVGATVIAEGVEDARTLRLMSKLGVDQVQGWVFGKGRSELWSAWQPQRPVGFAFPERVPAWPGVREAIRELPSQRMGLEHPES